jgi:hypothetical protein
MSVEEGAFILKDPYLDMNPSGTKASNAPSGHERVRIFHPYNHTRKMRLDQGVGTRRSLANMRAWLKVDDHRHSSGIAPEAPQAINFRMRSAEGVVPAL